MSPLQQIIKRFEEEFNKRLKKIFDEPTFIENRQEWNISEIEALFSLISDDLLTSLLEKIKGEATELTGMNVLIDKTPPKELYTQQDNYTLYVKKSDFLAIINKYLSK